MSFKINEVIQSAVNAPTHPAVHLQPYESADTFSAGTVARMCAGFAQASHAALTYAGPNAAELQAELTDLDSQIDYHKNEVARLRAELIKQTGGAEAAAAAAAAGMDIEFDPTLVSGQREHEKQRYALSQQRATVSSNLVTARRSVAARAELVSIIAALIGGLA